MEVFDTLPKQIREALTIEPTGSISVNDLALHVASGKYSLDTLTRAVIVNGHAAADKMAKDMREDLERNPIQWKWKKAPLKRRG